MAELARMGGMQDGDVLFFLCDSRTRQQMGGDIRNKLGHDLDLIEKDVFRFCWIVDLMFEKDPETGEIGFSRNPFSMPRAAWMPC